MASRRSAGDCRQPALPASGATPGAGSPDPKSATSSQRRCEDESRKDDKTAEALLNEWQLQVQSRLPPPERAWHPVQFGSFESSQIMYLATDGLARQALHKTTYDHNNLQAWVQHELDKHHPNQWKVVAPASLLPMDTGALSDWPCAGPFGHQEQAVREWLAGQNVTAKYVDYALNNHCVPMACFYANFVAKAMRAPPAPARAAACCQLTYVAS